MTEESNNEIEFFEDLFDLFQDNISHGNLPGMIDCFSSSSRYWDNYKYIDKFKKMIILINEYVDRRGKELLYYDIAQYHRLAWVIQSIVIYQMQKVLFPKEDLELTPLSEKIYEELKDLFIVSKFSSKN